MTPSLLEHLTGAAQAAPLPPAPENIMAAVASLPEASQDEVLKGMGFSRPVAPAPAPVEQPVQNVVTSAQEPTVCTEPEHQGKPKRGRGRPPKAAAPTSFAAELMLACAAGGNGTDEYDLYVARAKEAGLL